MCERVNFALSSVLMQRGERMEKRIVYRAREACLRGRGGQETGRDRMYLIPSPARAKERTTF